MKLKLFMANNYLLVIVGDDATIRDSKWKQNIFILVHSMCITSEYLKYFPYFVLM